MMAKIYFNRLFLGTITFDAIPDSQKQKVREYGKEYVEKGKMTVEEYEMLYKEPYEK